MSPEQCPACDSTDFELVFRYEEPPEGETEFELRGQRYEREFWACGRCAHFLATHDLDLTELYEGAYAEATYGDRMAATYERIMALPPERSDNTQRVGRLVAALEGSRGRRALDVGSGLGVFPARMKEAGWDCVALDPDATAVEHLRTAVGVEAVRADFMAEVPELGEFDLVTLNKVLEHVEDPVGMLKRARRFLREGGYVYVEVPDGEFAATGGPGREEFFIEHLSAFSAASLSLIARRAGFVPMRVERLREPSDKFTLFTLLAAQPGNSGSPDVSSVTCASE